MGEIEAKILLTALQIQSKASEQERDFHSHICDELRQADDDLLATKQTITEKNTLIKLEEQRNALNSERAAILKMTIDRTLENQEKKERLKKLHEENLVLDHHLDFLSETLSRAKKNHEALTESPYPSDSQSSRPEVDFQINVIEEVSYSSQDELKISSKSGFNHPQGVEKLESKPSILKPSVLIEEEEPEELKTTPLNHENLNIKFFMEEAFEAALKEAGDKGILEVFLNFVSDESVKKFILQVYNEGL